MTSGFSPRPLKFLPSCPPTPHISRQCNPICLSRFNSDYLFKARACAKCIPYIIANSYYYQEVVLSLIY